MASSSCSFCLLKASVCASWICRIRFSNSLEVVWSFERTFATSPALVWNAIWVCLLADFKSSFSLWSLGKVSGAGVVYRGYSHSLQLRHERFHIHIMSAILLLRRYNRPRLRSEYRWFGQSLCCASIALRWWCGSIQDGPRRPVRRIARSGYILLPGLSLMQLLRSTCCISGTALRSRYRDGLRIEVDNIVILKTVI